MSAIKNRIGQYHYADGAITFVKKGGTCYTILVSSALNAGGLIGPEYNGIVILNQDKKTVVLDQHLKIDSGYFGPSAEQLAEFKRIALLPDAQFDTFCCNTPRFRPYSLGNMS